MVGFQSSSLADLDKHFTIRSAPPVSFPDSQVRYRPVEDHQIKNSINKKPDLPKVGAAVQTEAPQAKVTQIKAIPVEPVKPTAPKADVQQPTTSYLLRPRVDRLIFDYDIYTIAQGDKFYYSLSDVIDVLELAINYDCLLYTSPSPRDS